MKPGDRFGSLVFVGESDRSYPSRSHHRAPVHPEGVFRCDCGLLVVTRLRSAESGYRTDCNRCAAKRYTRDTERFHATAYGQSLLAKAESQRTWTAAKLRGATVPAVACEGCGGATGLGGHHEDYRRPLDVIWLCNVCHPKRHAELVRCVPLDRSEVVRNHAPTMSRDAAGGK